MVKITPKVRTILLCLLLIGSCFTTYATSNLSFLTPTETDTNVSFFKVSKDETSPVFQIFSQQKLSLDKNLSINISEKAADRFNSNTSKWGGFKSTYLDYQPLSKIANLISSKNGLNKKIACNLTITSLTVTHLTVTGVTNGTVTVTNITGGTGIFEYSLNDKDYFPAPLFLNLASGDHTYWVKDSSGCKASRLFKMYNPLEIGEIDIVHVNCFNGNDGSVSLNNVSGGDGNYMYRLVSAGPYQSSKTFPNLTSGDYRVYVTDGDGREEFKDFTIDVTDNIAPTVITKNITIVSDITGNATITAADVDNGSNDACGIKSRSVSPNSFTCANVGANTVTLTITDSNNNVSTNTAIVNVQDNVSPTVLTQNIAVQLDTSGNASITAADVDNGSSDACGIKTMTVSPSSFACANVGANSVTLTVTDNNNNVSTKTATVTVLDNVVPIALTQNITVQLDASGVATIVAEDVDNGSNDACGINTMTVSPGSFNCSNVGANSVTLTVTDNNNNVSTNTATVTVEDVTAPNLPVLQDITWGCEYTLTPPTTTDSCDTNVTVTASRSTTFTTSGSIIWTFTDDSNNSSQSIEQIITINQISVSINKIDILCNGASTGEVEAIVTGGVAPFTYDWGTQGAGAKKTGLSPGNYSVKVTDANGCTAEANETITQPATFVKINSVTINNGCNGVNNASIIIDAEGGTGILSYYLDENLLTDNTADGLSHKNYIVKVIDENDCFATQNISITEPAALAITEVKTTETTSFGSATGTATALVGGGTKPYTYTWLNEQGVAIGQTGQTAKNLKAGKYSVIVTDANDCHSVPDPAPFTIYDTLYSEISISSKCIGDGGAQELRTSYANTKDLRGGSGNYKIQWDFDNPNTVTGPDANGLYTIKYNAAGQRTINLTITDNETRKTYQTSLSLYVGECYGKCTAQDLDVGNYYIGKTPNGAPLSDNDWDNIETITTEGIWIDIFPPSLNAKRHNFYAEYVIIIYHEDGSLTEIPGSPVCRIGEIDTSKPQKVVDVALKKGDIISLEKLFISVSSSRSGGCNSYSDTNNPKCTGLEEPQNVPTPLSVSGIGSQVLCINNPNGHITARAAGHQGTLQFTLQSIADSSINFTSPVQTSNKYTFNSLPVGEYNLTVTDNKGNDSALRPSNSYTVQNIKVTPPDNPLELAEATNTRVELACSNGNNAEVEVRATGGKAPYIYTWEDGRTGNRNTNLSAGTTWVKAIDDNGCEKTLTVEIVAPPQVIASAGTDVDFNCGISKVELAAIFPKYINPVTNQEEYGEWTILNGATGATFSDKNSPNSIFTIITSGSYTLQWTVPCGGTDTVKITFKNCSTLDFDGVDDHIDLGANYNPTSNYTMEAWIRPLDLTGSRTILSKRDNSNLNKGGFDLIIENSYPKFRWNGSSSVTSSHIIKTDRWYHVAVIIGGNDAGLYVDGILVSTSVPEVPIDIEDRFLIGATNTSADLINPENFFKGWIEEVRIWDTSLTQNQLQFLMNQRIKVGVNPVQGTEIPNQNAYGLSWSNLKGYYRLIAADVASGFTKDLTQENIDGRLINILSTQKNTAPLPYVTAKSGDWNTPSTWAQPNDWNLPNSLGINNDSIINWNIVKIRPVDKITYNIVGKELKLLGLIADGNLNMKGTNQSSLSANNGTGSGLNISKYFELNGILDLDGESQLVQPVNSQLITGINGYLMRDQQGTANSYNYNYWSSPVSTGNTNTYSVAQIMRDGTVPNKKSKNEIPEINFGDGVTFADGAISNPIKISNRWIYKFKGEANEYSNWSHLGSNGQLNIGEGYTMKGTTGSKSILTPQNYIFIGTPNNDPFTPGTDSGISLSIGENQNYLIGNPYPSAIDATKFILDNLKDSGGKNTNNQFNGALYFWDHFAGKSHDLKEYIGGYATYNLTGGVPAIATDDRINSNGNKSTKRPGNYIPVGQGFFINTVLDPTLSDEITINPEKITFKNSQRIFYKEISSQSNNNNNSQFLKPTILVKGNKTEHKNSKIRLDFKSPLGYIRQILVGTNEFATNGFDLGFDAPLNEYNIEDFFWLINDREFVIQGVNNFNVDQVLPVGMYISEKGKFSIEIYELENVPDETEIYLKDIEEDKYYDLRDSKFEMEIEAGDYFDRFEIVFSIPEDYDPNSAEEESEEEDESEEDSENEADSEEEDSEEDSEEEENSTNEDSEEESSEETDESTSTDSEEEVEKVDDLLTEYISILDIDIHYMSRDRELAISNPFLLPIKRVEIYNLLGQQIQKYIRVGNQKEIRLPVSEYATGIYVVKLYSENSQISKNIMLKQ